MLFFVARRYRCIADDGRGHGRSNQPRDGHEMDTYARARPRVLRRLVRVHNSQWCVSPANISEARLLVGVDGIPVVPVAR